MWKNIINILVFIFAFVLSFYAQNEGKTILFVGNSYTYFWNLPQTVETMSLNSSQFLDTRQSTNGGVNLAQHWNSDKNLKTRAIIEENDFDIVVLQDHSMATINALDSLMKYGGKFFDLLNAKGSEVYLYMTWAREWDPFMQNEISEGYRKLAQKTGAKIVPVGLAWEESKRLRPDLLLYDADGSHPNPSGTYLTACVFYYVLTGESPIGLPKRIISEDKKGDKLYLNIQSENDALFLQKVAKRIVDSEQTK